MKLSRRREDGSIAKMLRFVMLFTYTQQIITKQKDICVAPPGPTGHYRDSWCFPAMQMQWATSRCL